MTADNTIRILSAEDVRRALPMAAAIDGMKQAYAALSGGSATVPLRTRIPVPAVDGVTLFMPAYMPDEQALAVKVVSVFPQNAAHGQPMVNAVVLVLDAATGRSVALLDGGALTAIRTGAGGGASIDVLAKPDASVMAVLGSGVQARSGLAAACAVRAIRTVRVYSPNRAHCEQFAAEMAGREGIPSRITVVASAQAAVRGADIVYAATTSTTPVFDGRDLTPGAHVVGVGSYTPAMQEVDAETVRRARVVVDSREAVSAEAGDLIVPLRQGLITTDHIHAELGQIILGQRRGRTSDQQITFFKSVGVAVQDAVAARIALANAVQLGLGATVRL